MPPMLINPQEYNDKYTVPKLRELRVEQGSKYAKYINRPTKCNKHSSSSAWRCMDTQRKELFFPWGAQMY